MKSIIITLTFIIICSASGQSILTLDAGTTMGVLTGADLCANTINGSGIIYGGGTVCGGLVAVEPGAQIEIPQTYGLSQNYPNPFNPVTTIKFGIPHTAKISLKVYDILGREVEILFNNVEMNAGTMTYDFDGTNLASGVYFYSLIVNNILIDTKRMVLVK